MKLHILRQVANLPPGVEAYLEKNGQLIEYEDGRQFIDNDHARNYEITESVMRHTRGFAVVDESFSILGEFSILERAERARKNAKIQMAVDVEIEDEASEGEAEAAASA